MRCTAFLNFCGIVVGDGLAVLVEERALAVALEDGAEVPAVAVVVGELRVLELRVEAETSFRNSGSAPLAADRRLLGVAVEDLPRLLVGRVLLLLRPHEGRVGLVVPHDRAVVAVHEHVGLVHVADHALRGRDRARELVADGVPRLVPGDGRVLRGALARVAVLRVDRRSASRRGRWRTPCGRRCSPRSGSRPGCSLVPRNHRCGSFSRVLVMLITGTAMRLPVPGPRLDCLMSGRPGSSSFCSAPELLGSPISGKLRGDDAPAALEDAEDVRRRDRLPRRAAP